MAVIVAPRVYRKGSTLQQNRGEGKHGVIPYGDADVFAPTSD